MKGERHDVAPKLLLVRQRLLSCAAFTRRRCPAPRRSPPAAAKACCAGLLCLLSEEALKKAGFAKEQAIMISRQPASSTPPRAPKRAAQQLQLVGRLLLGRMELAQWWQAMVTCGAHFLGGFREDARPRQRKYPSLFLFPPAIYYFLLQAAPSLNSRQLSYVSVLAIPYCGPKTG